MLYCTISYRIISCHDRPCFFHTNIFTMRHPFCSVFRLIFKSLGIRCVPFLDQIVPYLLQVARKCGPGLRESLLQQLSLLTSIVHHNIAPFLPALFDIIRDYWSEHQEHILILGTDFNFLFFPFPHFIYIVPTYLFWSHHNLFLLLYFLNSLSLYVLLYAYSLPIIVFYSVLNTILRIQLILFFI